MTSFIDAASIIETFVQAILYGLYLATLMHTLRWLVFADEGWTLRKFKTINAPMLVIAVVIALLMTADLDISVRVVLDSTARLGKTFKKGYWLQCAYCSTSSSVQAIMEPIARMITDGVLIYRCYIVYGESLWIIVLPVILMLGSTGCLAAYIYENARIIQKHPPNFNFLHIIEAVYSATAAVTIYTTVAIVYKIWHVGRNRNSSKNTLRFSMRVIAESGMLFTITSILFIAVAFDYSPKLELLQLVLSGVSFSMTGIAFNLIIIRVFQHRVQEDVVAEPSKLSTLRFNIPAHASNTTTSSNINCQPVVTGLASVSSEVDLECGMVEAPKQR
ncbi:hypothetical protein AMATHDRAFT_6369 [Amanita thiersii Skay4041]|uniref:Uncharacterized protein n=1 Tax=Amanita thiersii Skay4041 TaxID=703135 RepID=A0A2A9NJ95_9AGAR|nr:hypothetical protein AMATHDRAFT_6369 [Amanita thiersii Skay4041]